MRHATRPTRLSRPSAWLPLLLVVSLGGSPSAVADDDSLETIELLESNVRDVKIGDAIPVATIPDGIYLRTVDDPNDDIWERLPEYRIRLNPAPAVHASVRLRADENDTGTDVIFTPARTSERMYLRMRWRDPSRDVETRSDAFRDGAAVQFSLGGTDTSFMMGTGADAPVNIWYWRSDIEEVENLAAGGFGSTTRLPEQPVSGASAYRDRGDAANEWVLVMSRALAPSGDFQADFTAETVPMALALWQGASGQRDGSKSVTIGWLNLALQDAM